MLIALHSVSLQRCCARNNRHTPPPTATGASGRTAAAASRPDIRRVEGLHGRLRRPPAPAMPAAATRHSDVVLARCCTAITALLHAAAARQKRRAARGARPRCTCCCAAAAAAVRNPHCRRNVSAAAAAAGRAVTRVNARLRNKRPSTRYPLPQLVAIVPTPTYTVAVAGNSNSAAKARRARLAGRPRQHLPPPLQNACKHSVALVSPSASIAAALTRAGAGSARVHGGRGNNRWVAAAREWAGSG